MLQQDTLLNHRLIWLGKEVILFDVVLVLNSTDLSHVPLQIVALEYFRVGTRLLSWSLADLLLIHTRELLRCALLDRIRLEAIHIISATWSHVLIRLVGTCSCLSSLVCVLN